MDGMGFECGINLISFVILNLRLKCLTLHLLEEEKNIWEFMTLRRTCVCVPACRDAMSKGYFDTVCACITTKKQGVFFSMYQKKQILTCPEVWWFMISFLGVQSPHHGKRFWSKCPMTSTEVYLEVQDT